MLWLQTWKTLTESRRSRAIADRRRSRRLSPATVEALEPRLVLDSTVVFNEIMYNPAGDDTGREWIELHNQMAVDMDVSLWRIDGAVEYDFPEETVIPGHGYLVVAADPDAFQTEYGVAGVLGPFAGSLSNGGETLELYNNFNSARTRALPPPPPAADKLWSVDIQAVGGVITQPNPPLKTGVEASSGWGDVWNAFNIAGHTGTTLNPTLALVNSAGTPTGVTFSIAGAISGWSENGDGLTSDYLFVAAGNSPTTANWQITGLDLAKTYSFFPYGSSLRDMGWNVDRGGDGSLANDAPLVVSAAGTLVEGVHPDATGKIVGSVANGTGDPEGNWAGFQLLEVDPTPGGAPDIAHLPGPGGLDGRRLMNSVNYDDGDDWPIEPDGSGASLAKIDPDAGSAQAENWTFSNTVGGTPGVRNFSDGRPLQVSQISDASGNGRHGAPFALGTVAEGFEGRAGSFDGATSYVEVPIDLNPTANSQITFGAWVRSDTTSPTHAIVSNDDGGWDRSIAIGSGVAPVSPGNENVWNAFNVQGHNLTSTNPSMNLVDRDGAATSVSFSILGTISGFSNAQNPAARLTNDYMFVSAGNSAANADWTIAGLVSQRQYDFYAYGGIARDASMRVDTNGDGSLAGETTRMAPVNGGILIGGVTASNSGQILGNVGPGSGGEGNWSGFQLVDRVTGQLWSVDIQAINGPLFGQQPPLLQSGPLSTGAGVGYSAFAGGHQFNGSGITADPATWAFVAGAFDQTTNSMTLYVDRDASTTADAVQVFTDAATAFGTSLLPTNIGRLPSGAWYFDGLIDNVFFADGALSAGQITALRDGGAAAVSALGGDLLAFYPFEDVAPGDTTVELPALVINEFDSSEAALFRVELVNSGDTAVNLAGMVLSTNETGAPDYSFPAQMLAAGGRIVVDEVALGFRPNDGDALFLFTAGKTSVVDAGHVDNSPRARYPDVTGPWLEPTTMTLGGANVVDLRDEIAINEIMYHGYPDRGTPPTPAEYATTTLLDWNATWRYNQVGQSVAGGQLPTNWAATSHPVDGSTWLSGNGLFALEPNGTIADIRTPLTLGGGRTTYYFETEFTVPTDAADGFELQIEHYIDDGALFYLNGVEIVDRVNLPAAGVTNATFALAQIEAAVATVVVSADRLAVAGFAKGVPQRLSVEVHQGAAASSDVVFGTRVHTRVQSAPGTPGTPYAESNEEWIELYNRSATTVDLTGWSLRGGVDYAFVGGTTIPAGGYLVVSNDAAALAAKYPAIAGEIVGIFSGTLSNSGETVRLEDPLGNPADEVRYYDGGRWPAAADGGGSSLELRDPGADNAQPAAWAASDESAGTAWRTYTYRGIAVNDGIGNDVFRELVLGMLDAGELLLDDISVVERPGTPQAVAVIRNGSFETDALGSAASSWRIIGNHSGTVIADPTNAANKVLRLVATGPTEDKHNHAETTFAANRPIAVGAEYEISFRAKWISGSNQLNSRLYFNFLQQTTLIDVSHDGGTPAAQNSRFAANVGPTYTEFYHGPVVPKANEEVTESVAAADPDGVASMALFYSVGGGGFSSIAMTDAGGGRYTGKIPGQAAASVVQFYVQGADALGAVSTYPADGASSRALYVVEDGQAAVGQLHNLRIVMTPADRDFLYLNTNRMSNAHLGATVIYDEREVFYDVGAQLKGSAFGRFAGTETGFSVRFNPDELFRGVHETISIERAGNKKELLAKHMYGRAGGGLVSFYDDVIRIVAPRANETGVTLLSMARYSDVFLDESFDNGGEGALYNMELLYNPNGTVDGNPESLKLNNPYNHTNGTVVIADRGDDKETYRWNYQMRNARGRDDYAPLIELMQAFSLAGSALDAATQQIMDVDQWMRTWAMFSLNGNDDLYTRVYDHNYRMYVRPEDGKIIGMPWDLDRAFQIATNAPLWGDENLRNVIELPTNKRLFYGHLFDIANTTANADYMTTWATHFAALTGQSFSGELGYIVARSNYVLGQLPGEFSFDIATADPLDVGAASTATLTGRAWIDVREIRVAGSVLPLDVAWTATPLGTSAAGPWSDGWQMTIPVDSSTGLVTLEAYDHQGNLVGTDTITVASTAPRPIVDQLRIVELMYNPPGNGDGEEFVEIMNVSAMPIASLAGVHFTNGLDFTFGDVPLAAGQRAVIVRDLSAFEARYGSGINVVGEYTGSALDNSGEQLTLVDSDGALVQQFTYDDTGEGWHPTTDGEGYSLVIIDPTAATATWDLGGSWQPSFNIGGSPGAEDTASLDGDVNGDLQVDLVDLAIVQSHIGTTSGATRELGDLNGDGAVNRADVAILAANFGRHLANAAAPAAVVARAADLTRQPTSGQQNTLRAERRVRRANTTTVPLSSAATDQVLAESTDDLRLAIARRTRVVGRLPR
ncbi:MAG: lamin tail domain-containing protein [Pirellulales bacterium]